MLEFLMLDFVSHSIRDMMMVKKSLKLSLQHGRPDLFGKINWLIRYTMKHFEGVILWQKQFYVGVPYLPSFVSYLEPEIFRLFCLYYLSLRSTPYQTLWYFGQFGQPCCDEKSFWRTSVFYLRVYTNANISLHTPVCGMVGTVWVSKVVCSLQFSPCWNVHFQGFTIGQF